MEERVKKCLRCGGTGRTAKGEICECKASSRRTVLPSSLKIPVQYQGVRFDKSFVRQEVRDSLGTFLENLLRECTINIHSFYKNYLICAPANSGKTVWAYDLYSIMYAKGYLIPEIMDLMQVRDIIVNYYSDNKELLELINTAKIMVVKLPADLPNKFPETISTIIERRVRNNCSTFFLYNGTKYDIEQQDKFGKLKYMFGDGSFNSICVKSFEGGGK